MKIAVSKMHCYTITNKLTGMQLQYNIDELLGRDYAVQQCSSVLFLLKLKEERRVSQAVVNDVIFEATALFSHSIQRLKAGITSKLASEGVDVNLEDAFAKVIQPFEGLETCYKQEKYFKNYLNLVVSINHI